jgi:hypothetical protein
MQQFTFYYDEKDKEIPPFLNDESILGINNEIWKLSNRIVDFTSEYVGNRLILV